MPKVKTDEQELCAALKQYAVKYPGATAELIKIFEDCYSLCADGKGQ